jgi:hypothetical protein
MRLAERLNLRSRLLEARVEPYNTVAGPIRIYVLPSSIEVEVVGGIIGALRLYATR